MSKDFDQWNKLKKNLQQRVNAPAFREMEVWWCSLGVNIGNEADGKGANYTRPVLVVRKFNKNIFLGVPLTTQMKSNPYYFKINFKGRGQHVMISQVRLWESKRLTIRLGKLSKGQFDRVREAIRNLI